jgi:ribonuclease R
VQVVLDRILVQERRLQFSIVEEGIPLTGKKPAKPSKKGKPRLSQETSGAGRKKSRFAGKRGRRR